MQRSFKKSLAGLAVLGAVAVAAAMTAPAQARDEDTHTLLVQLPNGAVEQIEYTGPVAPRIVLGPVAYAAVPGFGHGFSSDPAFAAFEHMAAMMDQQAAAMLQQVAQMPGLTSAMPELPPGVSGYSVVTTINNGHACTRETEVRYDGRGMQPQTVSNVSGDCGGMEQPHTHTVPAELPAPAAPVSQPRTLRVRATTPAIDHGLVREAFYQHQ